MADHRSSIDDLLVMGATPNPQRQPMSPETQPSDEMVQEALDDITEVSRETSDDYGLIEETVEEPAESSEHVNEEPEAKVQEPIDEYGNKQASKTYTEQEVNQRINEAVRDRLARLERNQNIPQPTQQQVQQATQSGFEYNADSAESWQQQLEGFVKQTVVKMSAEQARQAQEQQEYAAQAEFDTKFRTGMSRFGDYAEVVGKQPITDAMVLATRGLADPAAFFYAAAKRAPKELQEIANMKDQYSQMMALGKLEERMKQSRQATSAPKPAARLKDDVPIPHKSNKQPSIEDLIAKDAAKKLAMRKQRQR